MEEHPMKSITLGLTALFLSASLAGSAAPKTAARTKSKPSASEVKYKAHCGMIYSAAEAKKYHYICPMDHKPLVKITSGKKGPGKS
jgi:hypothetical protein